MEKGTIIIICMTKIVNIIRLRYIIIKSQQQRLLFLLFIQDLHFRSYPFKISNSSVNSINQSRYPGLSVRLVLLNQLADFDTGFSVIF